MAFRVELAAEAEREADAILTWLIEHHAGETGYRWIPGMHDAIMSLETLPKRCPLAPESSRFRFEVRQLLYGRKPHVYRILFTIEGYTVHVLHIRRPRQQLLEP